MKITQFWGRAISFLHILFWLEPANRVSARPLSERDTSTSLGDIQSGWVTNSTSDNSSYREQQMQLKKREKKVMKKHSQARKALHPLLILFSSLLFTQQSVAQDLNIAKQAHLNIAEQARVRQAVRDSITSTSSYNGIARIPRHELYMMLFAEILMVPESAHGFTSEDWEIITSLPSHSDRRFRAITDQEMEDFCSFVETEKRSSVAAALEVATFYEKAKNITDDLLGRHYDAVVAKLSKQGQEALRQRVQSMNDRMELVHTDIDVNILAQSAPEYTIRMLKSGCVRTKAFRNTSPPEPLLLSEELVRNVNFGQ